MWKMDSQRIYGKCCIKYVRIPFKVLFGFFRLGAIDGMIGW